MVPHSAAILAGGQGTRLALRGIPKVMADVAGAPVIERQIEWLRDEGVTTVHLLLGHHASAVIDYFEAHPVDGVALHHVIEPAPLGTAGALRQLHGIATEPIWVVYGDVVCDLDLARIAEFHAGTGADLTLVVHPNDHPVDSDLVVVDDEHRVLAFHTKPHPGGLLYRNLVSAAVYLMAPSALERIRPDERADLARDVFPGWVGEVDIRAYQTSEYLKDMGTPERLARVTADVLAGKPAAMRLDRERPAVFLDRDGVLCSYVGDVLDPKDLELRPGVAETVAALNASGWLTLVVTNQPVLAKGMISLGDLDLIHRKMETELGDAGAWIDRVYVCPHHPDRGYPGEVPELKISCDCRKPRPGLLEQAAADFRIDMSRSFLVGDAPRDVGAATAFGIPALGVLGGESLRAADLLDAGAEAVFASPSEAIAFGLTAPRAARS